MPSNWLSPSDIEIVQLGSAEAVEAHRADIESLIALYPSHSPDFVDWLAENPGVLTLIYHGDKAIASIRIDSQEDNPDEVGKDALEFSGCVLPEYRDRGITQQAAPVVIRLAFLDSGKKKMLARTAENPEAQAALMSLGFKRIGKDSDKNTLYLLKRKDALA